MKAKILTIMVLSSLASFLKRWKVVRVTRSEDVGEASGMVEFVEEEVESSALVEGTMLSCLAAC